MLPWIEKLDVALGHLADEIHDDPLSMNLRNEASYLRRHGFWNARYDKWALLDRMAIVRRLVLDDVSKVIHYSKDHRPATLVKALDNVESIWDQTYQALLRKSGKQTASVDEASKLHNGSTPLRARLMALRAEMAQKAQQVYDEWDPEDIGGAGGICDEIAQEIAGVIANRLGDVEIVDGGHDGDDHAWNIVYDDHDAYGVDIHPSVYEQGGGYNWKKIPEVTIRPDDVDIFPLRREDVV